METNIDGFWDSDDGDRKYSAADFVGFFQDFFTNGIVAESTTYLQVRAKSGFDIVVDVGKAYINGGFFKPKTVTTLTIPDSGTTYGRHDIVVLRWDKALKKIYLDVKSGTTTLTRNEIIYELGIAKIYVAANAVEITQADITDLRFDSAYCGIVTGVIDTIDTSNLFAQYEAAWNKFVDQLGDSDKVTIYSEDEQARSDINTIFQTLQRNAPYKTLSGKASSSSVTFSEPFAETPQVLAVLNTSTTTAYRTLTLFVSNISTTGFSVDRDAVTGATNASVDALSTGAYSWIALGK